MYIYLILLGFSEKCLFFSFWIRTKSIIWLKLGLCQLPERAWPKKLHSSHHLLKTLRGYSEGKYPYPKGNIYALSSLVYISVRRNLWTGPYLVSKESSRRLESEVAPFSVTPSNQ